MGTDVTAGTLLGKTTDEGSVLRTWVVNAMAVGRGQGRGVLARRMLLKRLIYEHYGKSSKDCIDSPPGGSSQSDGEYIGQAEVSQRQQ